MAKRKSSKLKIVIEEVFAFEQRERVKKKQKWKVYCNIKMIYVL